MIVACRVYYITNSGGSWRPERLGEMCRRLEKVNSRGQELDLEVFSAQSINLESLVFMKFSLSYTSENVTLFCVCDTFVSKNMK